MTLFIDLGAVASDLEKMLRRLIGEDVQLELLRPGLLSPIKADPSQLEQVLMNLAVNARDAMPRGGRLLIEMDELELTEPCTLPPAQQAAPGRYVRLTVADTGHGIPEEIRDRIFEPFFTTKEPGKGTGLGLATVYGIVQKSGGFIRLHSEPGSGTRFEICLPSVEASGPDAPAPATPPLAPGGSETLLLVEDEAAVRDIPREALELRGYRVLSTSDGERALALARNYPGPIDLLVTDLVLPGISGADLARRLRSLRPGIRILYVSGYAADTIAQHEVLEHDVHLLHKPFRPDDLTRKVRQTLDAPAL